MVCSDDRTLVEAPNRLDLQVRILSKFQEGANGVRRWLPEQKENVFVVKAGCDQGQKWT